MNAADQDKIFDAMSIITNLEGQLGNLLGRGPRASKFWAAAASKATDAKTKKGLKDSAAGLTQLLKDAKVVQKDLGLWVQDARGGKLAGYATGKEFRDKVAVKRLASTRAFDKKAGQLELEVRSILGPPLYPGMKEVDVKVSMDSLKNFSQYFNEMRIALAKL